MQATFAPDVTKVGIAWPQLTRNPRRVRPKHEFLRLIEERAKSRAEIARVMKVAPARVTDMYKGERDLKYDEAVALAERYGLDAEMPISAERLMPVLAVCMRHFPQGEWSDQDVERLAEEIEFGLELLQSFDSERPTPEAIAVAGRAIAARLRDRHA